MKKLSPEETARYERSLQVEGFGPEAQRRLNAASVLTVGAGGLGSAALSYLAAAGIGHLGIADFDTVSVGNLQRQILYATPQIGKEKAVCAANRLKTLNPHVEISVHNCKITVENAAEIIGKYDIIIDCTDNYETRYLVDNFCLQHQKPFIYGTAEQMQGQLSTFHYRGAGGYADLYPRHAGTFPATGSESRPIGVLPPVPGVIGSLQALEAVKIITGIGDTLHGKLLTVDFRTYRFSLFRL